MPADTYLVLEVLAKGIAVLFGIASAVLTFLELLRDDQTDNTRRWFRRKLERIERSGIQELVTVTIQFVVAKKDIFRNPSEFLEKYIKTSSSVMTITGVILFVGMFGFSYIYGEFAGLIYICILIFSGFGVWRPRQRAPRSKDYRSQIGSLYAKIFRIMRKCHLYIRKKFMKYKIFNILVALSFLAFVYVVTALALQIDIRYSVVIFLFALPFYIVAATLAIGIAVSQWDLPPEWEDRLGEFVFAACVSFFITFVFLLVGHLSNTSLWVPQTLQMLASNVVFDGLTLIVTLSILEWALQGSTMLRIPIAIVFDVAVAALLACCSLYFGLVMTDQALSVSEVVNVLVARAAQGGAWELGPYFWAMHTTFLPTLFYLFLITACWIAKVIVEPVALYFGKAAINNRPFGLTAALCFVFLTVFFALGTWAESAYKIATA